MKKILVLSSPFPSLDMLSKNLSDSIEIIVVGMGDDEHLVSLDELARMKFPTPVEYLCNHASSQPFLSTSQPVKRNYSSSYSAPRSSVHRNYAISLNKQTHKKTYTPTLRTSNTSYKPNRHSPRYRKFK